MTNMRLDSDAPDGGASGACLGGADVHSGQLKHFIISFTVSLIVVGFFVSNAYFTYNVGGGFEPFVWVGLMLLIPPGFLYGILGSIGLTPELRGRENFIESNPWLWIFCIIFYMLVIYLILRWRHSKKEQNQKNDDDDLKRKREALKKYGIIK